MAKAVKRRSGVVTAGRLNVREKAGIGTKVVKVIQKGDPVEIISKVKDEREEEWYHIPAGYVMAKWIEVIE